MLLFLFVLAHGHYVSVADTPTEKTSCPINRSQGGSDPNRLHTVLLQTHRGIGTTVEAVEDIHHTLEAPAASETETQLANRTEEQEPRRPHAAALLEKALGTVAQNMSAHVNQTSSVRHDYEAPTFGAHLAALGSVALVSAWGFMQIESEKSDSPRTFSSSDRSLLLDNAKVCALFFVIVGHFVWYNLSGEFKAQQAWLTGAEPMLSRILETVGPLKLPVLCFISGVCSQGETTPGRLRRFFTQLVAPTCIWIFFVKPVVYDTLIDGSFGEFYERLVQAVQFNSFHEEWYLQVLIFWRGSTFLIWNHLRPSVALVGMLIIGFAGGYFHFGGGPAQAFKIDEALGFLPYFAVGYVFPYEHALKTIGKPGPWGSFCAAVLVIAYTSYLLPSFFAGQLPNSHGPYGAGADKPVWDAAAGNVLEHRLYWCRRMARTVLDMTAILVWMFLALPRGPMPLSWVGKHTLYPYVWHLCMLSWWDKFLATRPIPVVTSIGGHALVIMLNTLVALLSLAFFASWPWRRLFDWCFNPTWLQGLADQKSATDSKDARAYIPPEKAEAQAGQPVPEPPTAAKLAHAGVGRPGGRAPLSGSNSDRLLPASDSDSSLKERTPSVSALSDTRSRASSVSSFKAHIRLPTMSDSKVFSKYLIPLCLLIMGSTFFMFFGLVGIPKVIEILKIIPIGFWVSGIASGFVVQKAFIYIFHFRRLWRSLEPPLPPPDGVEPLIHICVVVEYKEPIEVLTRTVGSIARQTHVSRRPVLVIATEARDNQRHDTCKQMRELCGDSIEEFIMTEHTLQPGESVGKHSNENQAVRDVWDLFVEERCIDPFSILITIIDADSLLSPTYLGHLEATFHEMPDGRRLLYNGPLNTYRNLGECNPIVQYMEIMRCHLDTFHSPMSPYHPQSNYSMTLGLAQEIGFWMPDCISEDMKCHVKSLANNFGSKTTVSVPAFICNDSVTSFSDRYVQAKRHQWGSVEEAPWHMKLAWDAPLNFRLWWQIFQDEAGRQGSLVAVCTTITGKILLYCMAGYILMYEPSLLWDPHVIPLEVVYIADRIVFWTMEMVLQSTVIDRQFPVMWPTRCELAAMMMFDYVYAEIVGWVFCIGATLDCLWHITFRSPTLTYVNAPKA